MKNFKIPSQWLKQGEKIRLPYWDEDSYWVLSKDGYGRILYSDGSNAVVHLEQLKNPEWKNVKKINEEKMEEKTEDVLILLVELIKRLKKL